MYSQVAALHSAAHGSLPYASRHSSRWFVLLGAVMLTAGCALGDPYVTRPGNAERAGTCADRNQCTVSEGVLYAYDLAGRYRQRLSLHARMESSVGAGGILLGSAVLALAASDANVDAFKAAGVLGATGYGLNTLYSNKPREEIYAKGMLALSCAVSAVRPLDLPPGELAKLSTAIDTIPARLQNVDAAAAGLRAVLDTGLGAEEQKAAGAHLLEDAAATGEAAAATIEAAAKLHSAASAAGNNLVTTVDAIGAAVDDALRKTVPEGSIGLRIAGTLPDLAKAVVLGRDVDFGFDKKEEGTTASHAAAVKAKRDAGLQAAYDRASAALIALKVALAPARGTIATFGGTGVVAALDACKTLGLSVLTVTPATIAFVEGEEGSASMVADNGSPPYGWSPVGTYDKHIAVVPPRSGDHRFDISTTKDVASGKYLLEISDKNGSVATVTIDVAAKKETTNPKPPADAKPPAAPPPAGAPALTKDELLAAMNKATTDEGLKGLPLIKNKYEVDSFTLNGSTIVVAIKGGGKVDAADQDDARADLHAAKVLKMPLSTWLKPLKLDLAFP